MTRDFTTGSPFTVYLTSMKPVQVEVIKSLHGLVKEKLPGLNQ